MKICLVSLRGLNCYLARPGGAPGEPRGLRGGSELQVSILARALAARGHEISVVVTDYSGEALRAPKMIDLPLIQAYDNAAGIPGLRFLTPRWSGLRRALTAAGADVYFQRGAAAATGQVAHSCLALRHPFVFGTASDSDVDPRRLRLGRRDRWLYRYGLRRAASVVTQHAEQRDTLREKFDVASEIIGSITPVFPAAIPEPHLPPRVLWLGNIRAVKRPELFLDLARRFPAAHFDMVGGSIAAEPEAFARARDTAAGLANVVFHGPVADPGPFLARAWVLVNTSRVEGFPSSFLEAWAHGVPTLSCVDPGGVVTREVLGVRAASPEDLGARLTELLDSRTRRDELGRRGRDYVAREHRAESVAAGYERVFAAAIGNHAGPTGGSR